MWRVWLLAGYAAGFSAAAFAGWLAVGGDQALSPRDVLAGAALAVAWHVPALGAVGLAHWDREAAIDRWVFRAGVGRLVGGAAAFGAAGVAVAAAAFALLGSGFRWVGVLGPPAAFVLANGWVSAAAGRGGPPP